VPACVVIPCHDSRAWDRIQRAIDSVVAQTVPVARIVLAVDHNAELSARLRAERPDVTVAENTSGSRGASGTRNAGAAACDTDLIAFLDDDETAEPDWLATLLAPFDDPSVVGTGGRYLPLWLGTRPTWFPDEMAWAVGGHHTGMPTTLAEVRNVWSGNMAVRAAAFRAIDGFRTDFGKIGARSRPEDTDLCIRLAHSSGGHWVYVPDAVIHHDVPADRATFGFFLRRCYAEGRGKIELRDVLTLEDTGGDALASERDYLRKTIPHGIRAHLREGPAGRAQAAAIVAGVGAAGVGAVAATGARLREAARERRAR
jgi:cellulose synthase/poly-beta-1,6-N-acetylglucosamine synthase-like glycosyltransferase